MKFRKIQSLKFLYEINEDGVIRNIKSKHILKPQPDKDGYLRIKTRINNENINRSIHRLVAECWCKIPDHLKDYDLSELQVNHKDFNIQNNNYRNLEWVTHKENLDYSLNRRLSAIRNSENSRVAYLKTFSDHNDKTKIKIKVIELDLEFDSSKDCAEYLVQNILTDKNVNTVARTIRKAVNRKNNYAYKFHFLKL